MIKRLSPILFLLVILINISGCEKGNKNDQKSSCSFNSDCNNSVCIDGVCTATKPCTSYSDCSDYEVCDNGYCSPVCITDEDCGKDGYCYNGICRPYPLNLDAPVPDGNSHDRLKAGTADVPLDFPVGVSMAGYGMRQGADTPYQYSLGGSTGFLDRPTVKALVLDDGDDRVVILRIPLCWSTDYLITLTAKKVMEQTGFNYIDRIITSAPHSHSEPARYWHVLPGQKAFAIMGYGRFSKEIVERITDSFAEAIIEAVNNLQPARFGYTIYEDFDPDNKIMSDRRSESPPYKLDRMGIIRIDDDNGNPIAVLFNFGMHGTHFESTIITSDAPGAAEIIAQQRLREATGSEDLMAFFIQGTAGNLSPRGDDLDHNNYGKIQMVGERVAQKILEKFSQIETKADVDLRIGSLRFPVTYDDVGYKDEEFFDWQGDKKYVYRFGAFQCVKSGDDDYNTKHEDGHLNCLFPADYINFHAPIPQFMKTRISEIYMDGLLAVTLPGEATSELGKQIIDTIKSQVNVKDVLVFAYSQDHYLYLLTADDWWQGGYEPSMTIWGWKFGDFLTQKALDAATELVNNGSFSKDNSMKPNFWEDVEDDWVEYTVTPKDDVGKIKMDMPDEITHFGMYSIKWQGGHPGVDTPKMHLVLQKKEDDQFVDVYKDDGSLYDEKGFETQVEYLGNYDNDHTWQMTWELLTELNTGTYRWKISGQYFDGDSVKDYTTYTKEFQVTPGEIRIVSADINNDQLELTFGYPPGPTNDDGGVFSDLEYLGIRLRNSVNPPYVPYPVTELPVTVEITTDNTTLLNKVINSVDETTVDFDVTTSRDQDGSETKKTYHDVHLSHLTISDNALSTIQTGTAIKITVTDGMNNSGTISITK